MFRIKVIFLITLILALLLGGCKSKKEEKGIPLEMHYAAAEAAIEAAKAEESASEISEPSDFWTPIEGRQPRFLFLHHSCGTGFLNSGGMWQKLEEAGFEVHDATYGDPFFGQNTDPNNFPVSFTQHYRAMIKWELGEGEFYDILAFKSCYPANNIISDDQLEQYKEYYAIVKSVTREHPETLFIPWSPPPLNPNGTKPATAARAREFATWLTTEYTEGEFNMRGYDCFNILAGNDPDGKDFNCLRRDYQVDSRDSHPNRDGNIAVASDFTSWLTDLVWPE